MERTEIEAKFSVRDEQTAQRFLELDALAGLSLGQVVTVRTCDRYLDTPSRTLLAHGYACRLRRSGDRCLATLKGLGRASGAVHRRAQVEVELAQELPPRDWPEGVARDLALSLCGHQPLETLFEIEQTRHTRPASAEGRSICELSLDRVTVLHGGAVLCTYLELEAELGPGASEADLDPVVAELASGWNLAPEPRSKFERALALLSEETAFVRQGQEDRKQLTPEERETLERLAKSQEVIARRARLLLAWDDGVPRAEALKQSGLSERRARHWLHRFRSDRLGIFPSRVLTGPGAPDVGPVEEGGPAEQEPGRPADSDKGPAPTAQGAPPATLPTAVSQVDDDKQAPTVPQRAPSSRAPGIERDDLMSEAGRKTLRYHFQRMLQNEAGTRLGAEIEALHDMRVATRRMRAAFRIFEEYFDPTAVAPLLKGLRRAGRALGTVRDLDVFRDKVQAYRQTLPPGQQAGLDGFLEELERQREAARGRMIAYLDGDKHRSFVERFAVFVETPGLGSLPQAPGDSAPRPSRVWHVAPRVIYERLADVLAYDIYVSQPDPPLPKLHALRIATKRLRYTLEFFQEVLGPETRALVKDTVTIQDHLGLIQDGVVASAILRDYLVWGMWGPGVEGKRLHGDVLPVIAPGVAIYLAARQVEIQQLVADFPRVWQLLVSPAFSRRLGAAVGVL